MATEKRLIDANEVLEILCDFCPDNIPCPVGGCAEFQKISRLLSADVVEVVRCENCQYWNPRYETMGMCMKHNSIVTFTKPDFYCAWGKEKNNGICKED